MDEEAIFAAFLEIPSPTEQAAYLDRVCGDKGDLRRKVEELLRAHAGAGNFLDQAAAAWNAHLPTGQYQPLTEPPGTVIGPYKLLEQIGEGGFGVVFLAEQQHHLRRKVALKVLKPGMDTRQVVARFEAERQALALMDHPNIAKVLDGGETVSGRPYFVMELVRGIPVTDFCDQNHLSVRQRLELFITVCQAVQHAHQKGIIHRDIKPSNIMVALYDGVPVAKVIDFGIAKATGQQLTEKTLFTHFAQMIGTPLYMSPEQAQLSGLDIDTRTDIYSLGVLLYELLTGTTPFTKERLREASYDEIRRIIREEEPPRPSTRISTLGQAAATVSANRKSDPKRLGQLCCGELDWIVMTALEKDRNRRYESDSALAADVQRYLNDQPVQACPPSALYRFRKFARRNKGVLATAGVLALAVLAVGASLVVSNVRISGEVEEKTKALGAAQASEEESRRNLKDALAAVDQMLTRVSEERLQYVPHMEPVRRDLLQAALKFYRKFLKRKGSDPTVRREAALAYRRMGFLHYQLGDYARAEAAYRTAFAMLDALDAESPLAPPTRSDLIFAHIECSLVIHNQGKNEEQEKSLRRAAAIAEALVAQFPKVPVYRDQLANASSRLADAISRRKPVEAEKVLRRNLALVKKSTDFWLRGQTWLYLGTLLAHQRRHGEAEGACRQAIRFFEKAAAQAPALPWLHIGVASGLEQLAAVLDAEGRSGGAEESYRRAIAILDRWAADLPAGPHYRWGQANVHFKHALLLQKLKRFAEAEKAYRRTVELFDKLVNDFPTLPGYRQTAVHRRHHLAHFLAGTGRPGEARQVYDKANLILEQLAPPQQAQALKGRGHFYAVLGEWDRAAADFTRAIELGSNDVLGIWYPLAVLHLRAKHQTAYRTLCARLLERRFGPEENRWVVVICKLAPDAVADLEQPVEIAKKLAAREPRNAEYHGILGDALYRQGDLEGAVGRLEASLRSGPRLPGAPWRKLVLAMTYHRLGRGAEAEQLFQDVTQWMANNVQKKSWAFRLDLQLLHHEAEELLKQDSGGKPRRSEKK
jgi:serine/threonine protein kinase/Tfp pilus assembly protein PilF